VRVRVPRAACAGRCAALVAAVVAALAATLALARPAAAQPRPELRLDAMLGAEPAAHAGIGLERDAGVYARAALVLGAGVARADGAARLGGRAEAAIRVLLDPLRQSRRGVGVRPDGRGAGGARAYLLGVVGVEGRARGGWAPSLEVGVGGGARLGLVIRRARAARR
jgi:hypothetical protein